MRSAIATERAQGPWRFASAGLRAFFGILPPRLPHSREATELGLLPPPAEITLQLDGAGPETVAVRPGEAVTTGQDLARPGCGPLVSTVTGRVARVTRVDGASGGRGVAVTISVATEEVLAADLHPVADLEAATPAELLATLRRLGLPGLVALGRGARVTTLVVSTLDEAPGCVINPELLRRRGTELGEAMGLWRRATGAAAVVLALAEDDEAPPGLPGEVRVVRFPAEYPNGLPEILALRSGGWLLQVTPAGTRGDVLVVGLETLLAGLDGLRHGQPFRLKAVSCLGPGERRPRNLTVTIGTPVAALLERLGLVAADGGKLVLGGPFRGAACPDPGRPVLADSHQLLLQDPGELHHFHHQTCTNCGSCTEICPVDLEVNLLGRFAEYDRFDRCAELAVERCVDCGLCAWACPAHRPLAQLMMHAKRTLWRSPERRTAPPDNGGCTACGPSCPAIRLFELGVDGPPGHGESRT